MADEHEQKLFNTAGCSFNSNFIADSVQHDGPRAVFGTEKGERDSIDEDFKVKTLRHKRFYRKVPKPKHLASSSVSTIEFSGSTDRPRARNVRPKLSLRFDKRRLPNFTPGHYANIAGNQFEEQDGRTHGSVESYAHQPSGKEEPDMAAAEQQPTKQPPPPPLPKGRLPNFTPGHYANIAGNQFQEEHGRTHGSVESYAHQPPGKEEPDMAAAEQQPTKQPPPPPLLKRRLPNFTPGHYANIAGNQFQEQHGRTHGTVESYAHQPPGKEEPDMAAAELQPIKQPAPPPLPKFVRKSVFKSSISMLNQQHLNTEPDRQNTVFAFLADFNNMMAVLTLLTLIIWFYITIMEVDSVAAHFGKIFRRLLNLFGKKETPKSDKFSIKFLRNVCFWAYSNLRDIF